MQFIFYRCGYIIYTVIFMEYVQIVLQTVMILLLIFGVLSGTLRTAYHAKEPTVLMSEGKIQFNALQKSRVSVQDLMREARKAGWFNLADVDTAVLETDGSISFLPAARKRSLSAKDFNFAPLREGVAYMVYQNGKMMPKNLQKTGFTEQKLRAFLQEKGYAPETVKLVLINESGRVAVFE